MEIKKKKKKEGKKVNRKQNKSYYTYLPTYLPFHYKFFLCFFLFYFYFSLTEGNLFARDYLSCFMFALVFLCTVGIILMFCSHSCCWCFCGWFNLSISLYFGGKEKHYEQLFDNIWNYHGLTLQLSYFLRTFLSIFFIIIIMVFYLFNASSFYEAFGWLHASTTQRPMKINFNCCRIEADYILMILFIFLFLIYLLI